LEKEEGDNQEELHDSNVKVNKGMDSKVRLKVNGLLSEQNSWLFPTFKIKKDHYDG
jgi:hypothetical protein